MMEIVFQLYELLNYASDVLLKGNFGYWFSVVFISILVISLIHWIKNRGVAGDSPVIGAEVERDEAMKVEGTLPKYRFRKRDKFLFYGRKLLRKINLGSEPSSGATTPVSVGGVKRLRKKGRAKPRVLMTNFAKLFRKTRPVNIIRPIKRPPPVFLEETKGPFPDVPEGFSPEVFWLLRNIRVFGHIQAPFIWDICKNHIEEQHISKGAYLFEPGMPDDSIYVVMKGSLSVILKVFGIFELRVNVYDIGFADTRYTLIVRHGGREGDREFVMKTVGEGRAFTVCCQLLML